MTAHANIENDPNRVLDRHSAKNIDTPFQRNSELRLLIDLTRRSDDPRLAATVQDHARVGQTDWESFIKLAHRHRVESLVGTSISANEASTIPSHIRSHFAEKLKHNSIHALANTRATAEITRALTDDGIPNILMKGQAVSTRFYEQPSARQSIDIDILVATSEIKRAQTIATKIGFKQVFPNFAIPQNCESLVQTLAADVAYLRPTDRVQLEIHWRLTRNPYLLNWDMSTCNDHVTQIDVAHQHVNVLRPAAQFVYLVCHGAKHAWFRLKWLADMDRMVRLMSERERDEAVRLSRRHGVMHLTANALLLLEKTYGLPEGKFKSLKCASTKNQSALRYAMAAIANTHEHTPVRMHNLPSVVRSVSYLAQLRPEYRYKVFALSTLLTDVRDIEKLQLSKKWLWLYTVLGPIFAAQRILKRELTPPTQTPPEQ